jgi:DNA-binding NtrC family response regulator
MLNQAILFVDDESMILDTLKEQLKRRFGPRYLYEMASSADEAWEILEELVTEQIEVPVVVSDWLMPGTKGDEFLIQVHQKYPQIITVLLTGQASNAAIARAQQQANLYRCLAKPWNEEELTNIILTGLD